MVAHSHPEKYKENQLHNEHDYEQHMRTSRSPFSLCHLLGQLFQFPGISFQRALTELNQTSLTSALVIPFLGFISRGKLIQLNLIPSKQKISIKAVVMGM